MYIFDTNFIEEENFIGCFLKGSTNMLAILERTCCFENRVFHFIIFILE